MSPPLKTTISSDRQKYLDRPVYRNISNPKPLAVAVAVISRAPFALPMREDFGGGSASLMPHRIVELDGYDRVKLQWMKPGPDGKLVPR